MIHLLDEYYNDPNSDTGDTYDPDCKAIVNPSLVICVCLSLLRFCWIGRLVDLLQLLQKAKEFNQILRNKVL